MLKEILRLSQMVDKLIFVFSKKERGQPLRLDFLRRFLNLPPHTFVRFHTPAQPANQSPQRRRVPREMLRHFA